MPMYPGMFIWWNPVFHFPLSGAVDQALIEKVDTLSQQFRKQMVSVEGAFTEIAKNPHGAAVENPELEKHLLALNAHIKELDNLMK